MNWLTTERFQPRVNLKMGESTCTATYLEGDALGRGEDVSGEAARGVPLHLGVIRINSIF